MDDQMTRDEVIEELLAAEDAGDIEAAEYWQAVLDEMENMQ